MGILGFGKNEGPQTLDREPGCILHPAVAVRWAGPQQRGCPPIPLSWVAARRHHSRTHYQSLFHVSDETWKTKCHLRIHGLSWPGLPCGEPGTSGLREEKGNHELEDTEPSQLRDLPETPPPALRRRGHLCMAGDTSRWSGGGGVRDRGPWCQDGERSRPPGQLTPLPVKVQTKAPKGNLQIAGAATWEWMEFVPFGTFTSGGLWDIMTCQKNWRSKSKTFLPHTDDSDRGKS